MFEHLPTPPPADVPFKELTAAQQEVRRAYQLGYCQAVWESLYDGQSRFEMEWYASSKTTDDPKQVVVWVGFVTEPAVSEKIVMAAMCNGTIDGPDPYTDGGELNADLYTADEWHAFTASGRDGEFD